MSRITYTAAAGQMGDTLVLGFEDEQLALTPDAREGATVHGAGAVTVERGEVIRRSIPFVAREPVLGELLVELDHDAVTRDLRDDRRRRHARAARVAVDEVLLRAGDTGQRDEIG